MQLLATRKKRQGTCGTTVHVESDIKIEQKGGKTERGEDDAPFTTVRTSRCAVVATGRAPQGVEDRNVADRSHTLPGPRHYRRYSVGAAGSASSAAGFGLPRTDSGRTAGHSSGSSTVSTHGAAAGSGFTAYQLGSTMAGRAFGNFCALCFTLGLGGSGRPGR